MSIASLQASSKRRDKSLRRCNTGEAQRRNILLMIAVFMSITVQIPFHFHTASAAPISPSYTCSWYQVKQGNTLSGIAESAETDIWTLARVNGIVHINLIFAGQQLCIPISLVNAPQRTQSRQPRGVRSNGDVRWYAYDALEWSDYYQARTLLASASAYYGLPTNLLLAIARQESNWRQHVISPDGGIGIMQIMPYTAVWINATTGVQRDPYKLVDNIFMGAFYLRTLMDLFHGNMQQVISAYNEGGWAVTHRGIMNWYYVNSVLNVARTIQ